MRTTVGTVVTWKAVRSLPFSSMVEAKSIFGSVTASTSSCESEVNAMTTRFLLNFFCSPLSWEMAFFDGKLQGAQKSRRTNLSLRSGFSPSHLSIWKLGAALPNREVADTVSAKLSSDETGVGGAVSGFFVVVLVAKEFLKLAS